MANNNNVGKNEASARLSDDIHFDLAPNAGADTLGSKTGQNYDLAALGAIIVARGATYSDGTAFVATDDIVAVEVDLKPLNGEGYNEGDPAQEVVATTSNAAYQNNGSWTDIDPGGGRQDGEDSVTKMPSSVDTLFVENGSILTVHITFQKAA